ncbi:MAG: peptidylprolyl isomerase [Hyphomonadaceae bacterium]
MRGIKLWAAAVLLAAAPLGQAAAQMTEGVAAVVNDEVISTYDVRQRALLLLASSGIEATAENQERARSQALRDLVDERLQIQEAGEFDINVTPDTIDRAVADIARQNRMTPQQFQASLEASGINIVTLRRQLQADTAWRRLINGLYGSRVRISDIQVRETQQRIASSATRDQYQVSEIFLAADNETEMTQAETVAARLLEEMQRGAPFPLVARQFSSAASSAAGGDLGWLSAAELRPEMLAAVGNMQPGQVSRPFRVQEGVYIIALRDRRAAMPGAVEERITLRQITAPAAQRAALQGARRRIESCDGLDRQISGVEGAAVVDLGTAAESDLSDAVRQQINDLAAGQAAGIEITGDQASFLLVCARETSMDGLPSRTEIENRLYEQELALLAQRYLRNLRRESTIITR